MKKIIFSIAFLFSFLFFFASVAFANDLEVQCDDTKCSIPSNDPLFDPNTSWTPEKSVTKEVVVKNVGNSGKEIFFRGTREGAVGSLDSVMNMELYEDGTTQLWSGSLEELLDIQDISLGHFTAGEEHEILLVARMDSDTSDSLQGSSSEFDFGFGFPGDLSSEGDEEENDTDDVSGGTSDTLGTQTTSSGGLVQELGQILTGVFTAQEESAAETDGEEVEGARAQESRSQSVLGVSEDKVCSSNYYWVGVIVLQILVGLLLATRRIILKIPTSISQTLLFAVATLAIYFLGCLLWPLFASAAVFGILFSLTIWGRLQ